MTDRIVLRTRGPLRELSRQRLIAQGLVASARSTATDVVQRMTCLQAQDLASARSAVALRAGGTVGDVDAALNAGQIVRSWPMRGTLHLVPAEDLRWMLALNAAPTLRSVRRRHEQLHITAADIDRAATVSADELAGGSGMTRAQLLTRWREHGIGTDGQRGAHLLQSLCLRAHLVLGPIEGRQQRFVLFDEWIGDSRPIDRDLNVAEWATRYFHSRGPATIADFRWWSGLLHRDIAPVWDAVRAGLVEVVAGDTAYFAAPETVERWQAHPGATLRPMLTPAFDELLLGYADRTPTVDEEHLALVVPGGNGMFQAVLLDGGAAVATWRRRPQRTGPQRVGPTLDIAAFDGALSARAERALPVLARRYPFVP